MKVKLLQALNKSIIENITNWSVHIIYVLNLRFREHDFYLRKNI